MRLVVVSLDSIARGAAIIAIVGTATITSARVHPPASYVATREMGAMNPCTDLTPEEGVVQETDHLVGAGTYDELSYLRQLDYFSAVHVRRMELASVAAIAPPTPEETHRHARLYAEKIIRVMGLEKIPAINVLRGGEVQARNFDEQVYICGHAQTKQNLYYLMAHELAHASGINDETLAELRALETLSTLAQADKLAELALTERLEVITFYSAAIASQNDKQVTEFMVYASKSDMPNLTRIVIPRLYENRFPYDIFPLLYIVGDQFARAPETRAYLDALVESLK